MIKYQNEDEVRIKEEEKRMKEEQRKKELVLIN
jgi:hypothetical protein